MRNARRFAVGLISGLAVVASVFGQEAREAVPTVYPTAVFPFKERGKEVRGLGEQAYELLSGLLSVNPELHLVERAELETALKEHELNLSGAVAETQAVRVGQLTGAKILVTGSVMQVGKKLYVIAKIIGTETSRVLGQSVKGDARTDLDELVEQLAEKVGATIVEKAGILVAKPVKQEDVIAALKEKLGDAKRPSVYVRVNERHVGQVTIDPAAQTEIMLFCEKTGFEVIDPGAGQATKADIVIEGEGFSEFATRRGNLVSVKARLEVKAIDPKTDKVIATDRETAVVVDLAEQHAGKQALQNAAAKIAARLLPKLLGK